MDRIPVTPLKSSSFSAATSRDEKLARNLSLGPIKLAEHIKEARKDKAAVDNADAVPEEAAEPDLAALSAEIDAFLASHRDGDAPMAVSEVTLDKFASAVEQEIAQSEGTDDKWAPSEAGDAPPLVAAIRRLSALACALTADKTPGRATTYSIGVHRVTGVLHRAMTFVEDEFHGTLEDPRVAKVVPQAADTGSATGRSMKRPPSFGHGAELDRCVVPTPWADASPPFPPETVVRLRAMAEAMFAAGYETECTQVFLVARRNASLQSLGYEKASIDDVVKMPWEALESEIATWIKAFQHTVEVDLPGERDLCARVFAGGQRCLGRDIFADLAHCAILHMLTFTEAVVLTKRAAEKLFKVLDMYEAIRDAVPRVDAFLVPDDDGGERGPSPADEDGGSSASSALVDLKHELSSVRTRLGESAAAIFCDLEGSIRADAGKQPVPGGAVHPLTRYLMNYLKYACEYKKTLEQVFQEYRRPDDDADHEGGGGDPFAA